MKTIFLVLFTVLVCMTIDASAQEIRVFPDAGTVQCSPRYSRFGSTNPYVAYMNVQVSQPAVLRKLDISMVTEAAVSPFPSALLFIDGVNQAVTMVHGDNARYHLSFSDFQAPLSAGGHTVVVFVINEINPFRAMESFGKQVSFSIQDRSDLIVDAGTILGTFPVALGTMTVAPASLPWAIAPVGEGVRPSSTNDIIGTLTLFQDSPLGLPVTVKRITVTSEARPMPSVFILDKFRHVIGRSVTRMRGGNLVIVFDTPPEFTHGKADLEIMIDAKQLPPGEFTLNFPGNAFEFVVGDDIPMRTERCGYSGSITVNY